MAASAAATAGAGTSLLLILLLILAYGGIMMGGMTGAERMVHDQMAVGYARDHRHLMADEHHRGMAREILHDGVYAVLELLVDIRQRFVKHQYLGIRDHGTSQQSCPTVFCR